MKQALLFLAVITFSDCAFSESPNGGGSGSGEDRREMMKNMMIRKELKAINKSHNPGANKAVYDQVIEDLASEGRSYNHNSLRSMMAFLAKAPDATCSFGKKAAGTRVPQYTESNSNYGINCISPSKGKKGRMFFSGLPSAVINSLASQQSHHVPDALMASYVKANTQAISAQSAGTGQQTAFETVSTTTSSTTAVAEPVKAEVKAVNPFPAFNPDTLADNPSSSATPVTGTAN